MTALEQQTINEVSRKLDLYIADDGAWKKYDKLWKDEIESTIKPLTAEYNEKMLLGKYGKYIWQGLVAILGIIATIGVIFNYIIRPYLNK